MPCVQGENTESGSVLWFILLAIALLVALTLTVTHSTENAEQTGTRESNRIAASAILRQAKGYAAAIERMRTNGISENNISFAGSGLTGYTNANCASGASCQMFGGADSAGLTYQAPNVDWLDSSESTQPLYGEWYFFGTACVPGVGNGDTGCSAAAANSELIAALPWVDESLCVEINRMVGVANLTNPTRPPQIAAAAYTATLDKFTGTFTTNAEIDDAAGDFTGKQTGCFAGAGANPVGGYHFYQVLIPR